MKLANAILRPGRVLEVLDNGDIKADVPGLFSIEDQDKLPPISFFGGYTNGYSAPKKFDEVWVLNLKDNPMQLYWFRKGRFQTDHSEIMQQQEVEVVCDREFGPNFWASIYFSNSEGWIIRGGEAIIQIRQDGSIVLNTGLPNRVIDINQKSISIGSEGKSAHPGAYGDIIMEILADLCGLLNAAAVAGSTNPYTMVMAQKIASNLPKIENAIPNISSSHVTID